MSKLTSINWVIVLFTAAALGVFGMSGCNEEETDGDGDGDSDGDGDGDGDSDGDGDGDGDGDESCPAISDREVVEVERDAQGVTVIDSDTTWTCDNLYILTGHTFVSDAVLSVEPGTVVQGDEGSALIVTTSGRLEAHGTAEAPIVFTSSSMEGARVRGSWGGVVLLGTAPINITGGTGHVEGIEASDDRGVYGGTNSNHNCGTLQHVRIEFAGYELSPNNELNGLTIGACGSDTTLDYIQVHLGDDDGVEFFGGTSDISHLVVTGAADDSVDWDEGWQGRVQFLIIQQHADESDNAFEADNWEDNNDASPRSQPEIWNFALIGPNDPSGEQRGMVLRRGTHGLMFNGIIMGFGKSAVDVRDAATAAGGLADPPSMSIESTFFYECGDGEDWFDVEDEDDDDDDGFDETSFFTASERENSFGEDPGLNAPYDITTPNFAPTTDSPAPSGATPPSDGFFDTSATFIGAIEPGGVDWTIGWTAYPAD